MARRFNPAPGWPDGSTHSLIEAVYLGDVVQVMAARPGRFIERIAIDLPRPRNIAMLGSAPIAEPEARV